MKSIFMILLGSIIIVFFISVIVKPDKIYKYRIVSPSNSYATDSYEEKPNGCVKFRDMNKYDAIVCGSYSITEPRIY